jgi:hypothetical protein
MGPLLAFGVAFVGAGYGAFRADKVRRWEEAMRSNRLGAIALAAVLAVSAFATALASGMLAPLASLAAELNPVTAATECPEGTAGFKIDDTNTLAEGTYSFGVWSVTIYDVQVDEDGETISFSFKDASHPVMYVLIKAGQGTTTYDYTPGGVLADEDLSANDGKSVSHISFCFGPAPTPTPVVTPTPTPVVTPTPTPVVTPTPTPVVTPTPTPVVTPTPTPTGGQNPVEEAKDCPPGTIGFKIDETNHLVEGTYTFGDFSVTIYDVQVDEDGETISFSFKDASQPVMFVVIKAGTETTIYDYTPDGVFADENLTADNGKAISHIEFCFAVEQPTPTPVVTPTPTPVVTPTPTPVVTPTPTPMPTESAQPTPTPTPVVTPTPTPMPTESAQPTPTPTPVVTPTPMPTESAQPTPTPLPTESAQPTPTPTAPARTLPPTNTLEPSAQPSTNLPVILLVLLAIGSIVIGATVLRTKPIRTRR